VLAQDEMRRGFHAMTPHQWRADALDHPCLHLRLCLARANEAVGPWTLNHCTPRQPELPHTSAEVISGYPGNF
jgi:hypothetical protein